MLDKYSDREIYEEFLRRFADATNAAKIAGLDYASHVNLMSQRGHYNKYELGPRFSMYSKAELEAYAASRPGKGGRPSKKKGS